MSERELYPGWETVRKIGNGSFGAVYEIARTLPNGKTEKAALKVISIPQNEGDVEELYSNGYDDASITAHFKSYLADIVNEYSLMSEIKGHTNVVYCDDIRYIQHDDGFGWDIFIKMELLTSLIRVRDSGPIKGTVRKLASDICSALVLCREKNIVHRDIKPQNIFVSEHGDYKLGDFGIAKTVEKTTGGTKIGTYGYMAPEVYNNQPYGAAADIYSLGLVMYWMLNEHRLPFLPMPPKVPTSAENEQARLRRFRGEAIPAPKNGSEELKRIVLKACAYDPKERYHTAGEMLAELNKLSGSQQPLAPPCPIAEPTVIDTPAEPEYETATQAVIPQQRPAERNAPEERKAPAGKEKKKRKSGKLAWAALCVLLLCCGLLTVWQFTYGAQATKYRDAQQLMDSGKYMQAMWAFSDLDYRDSAAKTQEAKEDYLSAQRATTLAAGSSHTVGIQNGGTVVATGSNTAGKCDVSGWWNIVSVAVGDSHTVGLRVDGTVVAKGRNNFGQCSVLDWKDIVEIAAGDSHTVGLHADGTVVAVGRSTYGKCDVGGWRNVVAIAAGGHHTVGLLADGTVVAVGVNGTGQCNVTSWRNIVAIAAGGSRTVGLRADGTVVAVGSNSFGQCDVSGWKDIVAIAAGSSHTVGLRADGTVVAVGNNGSGQCNVTSWENIVAIAAGGARTMGLRADGTVVAVGNNNNGQCNVSDWKNIRIPG